LIKNLSLKTQFDNNLEFLRGFAALVVVFAHLFYHFKDFNAGYIPLMLRMYELPAHLAVLIFFMLSGYVIGLKYKEPLNTQSLIPYLKKRIVRIYPIYMVAILVSLLVSDETISIGRIIAHFTLTQNLSYPPIWANNPVWSLNYEMLYYLAFVPISFFAIRTFIAFFICLAVGLISTMLSGNPIISAYAFGFCFWLAGMFIARNFNLSGQTFKVVPIILFILSLQVILSESLITGRILHVLNIHPPDKFQSHWSQTIVNYHDIIFLPYCFILITLFSGKDFAYRKIITLILSIPLIFSIYKLIPTITTGQLIALLFLAGSLISVKFPFKESLLIKVGTQIGSISFGIYIIHYPILFFLGHMKIEVHGPVMYCFKVVFFVLLTGLIAWLLEKKFQPFVRGLLIKKS
jgi:peptidoglycan/LPS O-acetylase OafA/YrhL